MGVKQVEWLINHEDVRMQDYHEVRDPGRLDDVVGTVAQGTAEDVNTAVQAAHQAFQSWRQVSLSERRELLSKAADLVEQEGEQLIELFAKEQGMLKKATTGEMRNAVMVIRNMVEVAESFFNVEKYEDEASSVIVEKRAAGVVAAIVPWNAPIILTMQTLAPTLVAGNTIVVKPSPFAPLGISTLLKKMAALFPPGVINVIHGDAEVGAALTSHPLVRKISFTGGAPTARHVMKSAAETLKGIHFELGGNDPAILLDDVKVDDILPKLLQVALRRSGQVCFAIKRIYVPEQIYDRVYDQVCQFVDELKIGHGLDERSTLGPLNNPQQMKYVQELIARAKQSSAKVRQLGQKVDPDQWENGYYMQPAVVRDIEAKGEIVTCEQFGPIVPLVAYRSVEEAIEMANDTEYGLSASVWSSDVERALNVTKKIESGMTYVNGHGQTDLGLKHMPFGGVKQSGIGRENTAVGLADYVEYHATNVHK